MGDRGSAHKVGTLFGRKDDLHSGGILQVIHKGDYLVTWSASLYIIGLGSEVYSSFLGEVPAIHGDTVDDEHRFSSLDRRSVRKEHLDVGGHAASMRPRS